MVISTRTGTVSRWVVHAVLVLLAPACSCEYVMDSKDLRVEVPFDAQVQIDASIVLEECADGAVRACGKTLGACQAGQQRCSGRTWGPCLNELTPKEERCNGQDDDCDGDIDEGFGVGTPCNLPMGCKGRTACSGDDSGTKCVIDEAGISTEVCDGLDNDCDGHVDYVVGPSRIVSVCECVEQRLSFGTKPLDVSIATADAGIADGGPLCEKTACRATQDALEMKFCLNCAAANRDGGLLNPYALCEGALPLNLTRFVDGQGDLALTVRFTLESNGPVPARVNLYYHAEHALPDGGKVSMRRYFPLLDASDRPGTHTRSFLAAEHTCFGSVAEVNCKGMTDGGPPCAACRYTDSCGAPTGSDCPKLSFEKALLQVAVEDCTEKTAATAVLRIHDIWLERPGCTLENRVSSP